MRSFDFSPLLRASVGFENLNRLADMALRVDAAETSYPPYDIEKTGEDRYAISIAAAGFSRDELEISVEEDTLTIAGKVKASEDKPTYLHRGIAKRAFKRQFQLAETVRVDGAGFENGLLVVDLVRVVPEHKKPRQIAIGDRVVQAQVDSKPETIEGEVAQEAA